MLGFLKNIQAQLIGVVAAAATLALLLWSAFRSGAKKAKAEAKADAMVRENVALKEVNQTIQDDLKVVTEIRNDVQSRDDAQLTDSADAWVRK
jgi:hypothetical protein